jgi:hypothetical protein
LVHDSFAESCAQEIPLPENRFSTRVMSPKKKTPAAMTSKGVVAVRHLENEPRFDEFRGVLTELSPEFQINQVPLFA